MGGKVVSRFRFLVFILAFVDVDSAIADPEIVERIKKAGEVCIEGSDCGQAVASVQVAPTDGASVEFNYNQSCATCHNAGLAGAPKFGDVTAWEERIAKGMDVLYASSINGMPPAMPQKGMCFSCSDDDLKALVDYMVEAAR